MRVYIAGPMTDRPAFNYPAFGQAAAHLRALGYEVINPAEMHPDPVAHPLTHEEYMRADLGALLRCAAVYLLPEWESSRGARLEEAVARACGIAVLALKEAEEHAEGGGMKVELREAEAQFVRAEAARLGQTPDEVVMLMVQCQMLADRAAGTTLGQQAMAQAAEALRAMAPREEGGGRGGMNHA